MATNPLQIPVIGGDINIPTPSVDVATPTIQGAPVRIDRSISDIMNTIMGVGETIIGIDEINKKQDERQYQSQRRTRMEQDEADRSELALLQKESSLWSADSEANGSVTFNKDEYKKFKSKISSLTGDSSKTPFFQAQVAQIVENHAKAESNTIYSEGVKNESAAAKAQHERNLFAAETAKSVIEDLDAVVVQNREERLNDPQVPEITINQLRERVQPLIGIPEVAHKYNTWENDLRAKRATERANQIKSELDDEFITAGANLSPLVLLNDRIQDPTLRSQTVTASKNAITAMFNGGTDLATLSGAMVTYSESMRALRHAVPNPSVAQMDYLNNIQSHFESEYRQFTAHMRELGNSKVESVVSQWKSSGNYDLTQLPNTIVKAYNDQAGGVVLSYTKEGGFTTTDPELTPFAGAAQKQLDSMTDWFHSHADQIIGAKNVWNSPFVTAKDIKDSKIDIERMSAMELGSIIERMPKGTQNEVFTPIISGLLNNYKLPNGSYNPEALDKLNTLLTKSELASNLLVSGESPMSDETRTKMVRAAVWFGVADKMRKGLISDAETRNLLGPIAGTSQDPNNYSSLDAFLSAPTNPVGTPDGKGRLEESNKTLQAAWTKVTGSTLYVDGPFAEILRSADAVYKLDHPKGLTPEIQVAYHKALLGTLGISLLDRNGTLIPKMDRYGQIPEKPADTIKAAMQFVPIARSRLHMSTLAEWSGSSPTERLVAATENMSMQEMYNYLHADSLGSNPKFSVSNSDTLNQKPAELKLSKGAGGIEGFSDHLFTEVFGSGIAVSSGSSDIDNFYVNSVFEKYWQDSPEAKTSRIRTAPTTYSDMTTNPSYQNEYGRFIKPDRGTLTYSEAFSEGVDTVRSIDNSDVPSQEVTAKSVAEVQAKKRFNEAKERNRLLHLFDKK